MEGPMVLVAYLILIVDTFMRKSSGFPAMFSKRSKLMKADL